MNDLRIIFMGTPEFAVASLEILVANGFNIVAVVTAPDRQKGRGQKIMTSLVKEAALKHNLPVLQPTNLKSAEFIEELKSYKANLQVVVAFRMLPEVIWNMPEFGTFNLHASLLPEYRGAAPINWAIINGETQTGLTTFFLTHEIDTGKIIMQEEEPIHELDTVGDLYERLMQKGAKLVLKSTELIKHNKIHPVAQKVSGSLKLAPKIFRATCEINWHQPGEAIRNFVRGLSPYPAAWTIINGQVCKIYSITIDYGVDNAVAGRVTTDNKNFLKIKTADGWVNIMSLQMQGKKRMEVKEFLRGNKIQTK